MALVAGGGEDFVLGDAGAAHGIAEEAAAVEDQVGGAGDGALDNGPADAGPGDGVLEEDEDGEAGDSLDQGDLLVEQYAGEGLAEGDGDDEVEGVHLR